MTGASRDEPEPEPQLSTAVAAALRHVSSFQLQVGPNLKLNGQVFPGPPGEGYI